MGRAREFRNPKELEWTYWISNGAPRLRPELDLVRRWKLKRWPDFGRLPHYHADVRMASALMAQALTLHELCDVAKANDDTAINFLNATFTLGALAAEATAAEASSALRAKEDDKRAAKAKPSRLSGLIGQLRRKFGLASA